MIVVFSICLICVSVSIMLKFIKKIPNRIAKFFRELKRETKIIIITMVVAFIINYFREVSGFIVGEENKNISLIINFFNVYANSINLVLNAGMMTVISSVFFIVLANMSENKKISMTKSVIIVVILLVSTLWYVCEILILPSKGSLWVTIILTILAIITYIVIVESSNNKASVDSDYCISGSTDTYK